LSKGSSVPGDEVEDGEQGTGDADVGLMAVWGLLNMSGFTSAQVSSERAFEYHVMLHISSSEYRGLASTQFIDGYKICEQRAYSHSTDMNSDVLLTIHLNIPLNLPSHLQVPICRYGLYTLLSTVHRSIDSHRKSASAAILNNIHFHPGNVTVLYRAELRLKQAALMQLEGRDFAHPHHVKITIFVALRGFSIKRVLKMTSNDHYPNSVLRQRHQRFRKM
jgi:hypothetical protein